MKKAISLFLAVSVLCFATSAFAATNSITSVSGAPRSGGTTFNTTGSGTMPCFRVGDTLKFNLSSLTTSKELTVISYKSGSSLSDSTVQYINQYTVDSASKTIAYKIRSQASGIYVLKFTDGANEIATFYYKVGNISAQLIESQSGTPVSQGVNGTYYRSQQTGSTYSIGFIGRVTITGGGGVTLADMASYPGFKVTNTSTSTSKTYRFDSSGTYGKSQANLQSTKKEISGNYQFVYGLTIYNVPSAQLNNMKAAAVLD